MILARVFLLLFILVSTAGAIDFGSISGRVVWEGGLGFVSQAKVIIYDTSGQPADSAIADETGNFRIDLTAGRYLVSAEKENLVREYFPSEYLIKEADEIEVSVGQNLGLHFELDFGGWISGNFSFDGENISNGLVTALKIDEPEEGWYKSVALDGPFPSAYHISGLLPGTYKILGRARGKATEYYPGVERIEDGSSIVIVKDVGVSDVSFELDEVGWGLIQGRVTDLADGAGVEGVVLHAYQWQNFWEDPNLVTAASAQDGSYALNVPAGAYFLFSLYPDLAHDDQPVALYYSNRYDPTAADLVDIAAGQVLSEINFALDYSTVHNLTITGEVISERTGRGIDDVVITAYDYDSGTALGSACSANDGEFAINDLCPGRYFLMFSGPQIIPYFFPQTESWQQGEIILLNGHFGGVRTEAITQDYGNFGLAISGRVTSSAGPVSGARIYAYHDDNAFPQAFAWSSPSGEYTISTGLTPGWYRIACDIYGYDYQQYPQTLFLDLATNPVINNIDFSLNPNTTAVNIASTGNGAWEVLGNYPNPFNAATSIHVVFGSDVEAGNNITVYNVIGQIVGKKEIVLHPGENIINWGAGDFTAAMTSGVYFYKFDHIDRAYRMIFLK